MTSIRVKLDKRTSQHWYNRFYGIWMDSEPSLLHQQLGAVLSEMLAFLNTPPAKSGMPKGYHYRIEECRICGAKRPANVIIRHIKDYYHADH